MWPILQQDSPQDFVLATEETHTVRSFIEKVFHVIGRKIVWEGSGLDEVEKDWDTGIIRARTDPRYFRPAEVDILLGDPTKANTKLGWKGKVTFDELVNEMVLEDIDNSSNSTLLV
jgi:GDPmannose 4,6-dehydratase